MRASVRVPRLFRLALRPSDPLFLSLSLTHCGMSLNQEIAGLIKSQISRARIESVFVIELSNNPSFTPRKVLSEVVLREFAFVPKVVICILKCWAEEYKL